MGEFLQKSYYDLEQRKVSPHIWQVIYNDKVLREFDTASKCFDFYLSYKKVLTESERVLLDWRLKWV